MAYIDKHATGRRCHDNATVGGAYQCFAIKIDQTGRCEPPPREELDTATQGAREFPGIASCEFPLQKHECSQSNNK